MVEAIKNHIIFQFTEAVNGQGMFSEETASGIYLGAGHETSAASSRWAKIVTFGPEVTPELQQVGKKILIENLKWTEGVKFKGETYWRTDDQNVLAYEED